jgi:hypothetical protein
MQELFDLWTDQTSVKFEDITNLFVQVGLSFYIIGSYHRLNALSTGRLPLASYVRLVWPLYMMIVMDFNLCFRIWYACALEGSRETCWT